MGRAEKIRLGDLLVAQKVISIEQLKSALELQKRTGRRLGKVLVENGFISEEQVYEALSRQLDIPYINLKFFNLSTEVARKLPETVARRHRAMVLEDRKNSYLVGMSDPTDLFAYDEIVRQLKRDVELAVISEGLLVQTIDRVYRRTEEISGLAKELEQDIGESYVDFGALAANLSVEEAPVVKMLQSIFEDAAQVNASDIHVEPQEGRLQIRFRIDGSLVLQTEADVRIGPPLILRLKLMAGLDISEKRLPQDGRFNVKAREQQIDVRMSTLPNQWGESAVLRVLNQSKSLVGLDNLGMSAAMLEKFRELIQRTNGMILVTGPTGSGKTTTLYAALSEINSIDKKIITVEDPVEYRLAGVNQVQVNEKIDLSFGRVLRSALRQDPDIILVGEMRDHETAQIGMRAALTGHLVLSTLHTRDAATTPIRLIDMGVPPYMVGTSIHAVLAQRLLRTVCESCRGPHEATSHEQVWLSGVSARSTALVDAKFVSGRGCSHCNGTGYAGRIGVYELLEMDSIMARAAAANDPNQFIDAARSQMAGNSLHDNAIRLAISGKTTLAEVIRVVSQAED